ncbi:MAG: hypothetical protein ACKVYV_02615 [Limisphaerales bacterium]
MNIMNLQNASRFSVVIFVAAAAASLSAHGQAINITTATSPGVGTGITRLFDSAGGVLSPVGSEMWFAVDTLGNGLNLSALPLSYDANTDTASWLGADDVLFRQDEVDGAILGNQPGKFQRNNISAAPIASFLDKPVYAFLFNTTTPAADWQPGQSFSFDVSQMSVTAPVGIGNYRWDIIENMVASENPFVVVPEPATNVAIGAALAAFGAVHFYRRRKLAAVAK